MIKDLLFIEKAPKVATLQDMTVLEATIGAKLPRAFHEFCFRWNGGFASKENQYYLVPSFYTEFYKKMFGGRKTDDVVVAVYIFYGVTEEFEQCNLLKCWKRYGGVEFGFIPIAENLEGNMAVLRMDSPMGMVYWIDSDTFEWPSPENREPRPVFMPIAPDLDTFYNSLAFDPCRGK